MLETTGTNERPFITGTRPVAATARTAPASTREAPRELAVEIDAWFRHVSGMNGFTDA